MGIGNADYFFVEFGSTHEMWVDSVQVFEYQSTKHVSYKGPLRRPLWPNQISSVPPWAILLRWRPTDVGSVNSCNIGVLISYIWRR